MTNISSLSLLQDIIKYHFKDSKILETALTHSSYSNERKKKIPYNERLEFLGDSVLNISISDYLFNIFDKLPEGKLTKIRAGVVSEVSLAESARVIGLGKYLRLGKGEEISGGRNRTSILADAFEALIGALYLDGGMDTAKNFILEQLMSHIKKSIEGQSYRDYKTELQEILQKNSDVDIQYELVKDSGPDHDKTFYINVKLNDTILGSGSGKSKKEAEQEAAKAALEANNQL